LRSTEESAKFTQQNLSIAEGHVVRARPANAKALIQYEEPTGSLLDRHHIALFEAIDGDVQGLPDTPDAHKPPN
jgi:hypothetical protein